MKRFLFLAFFAALVVSKLAAHGAPESQIHFHRDGSQVIAELQIPLSELSLALGQDLTSTELDASLRKILHTYLEQRILPYSTDRQAWTLEVSDLSFEDSVEEFEESSGHHHDHEGLRYFHATLSLAPPKQEQAASKFALDYTVVHHEVNSHRTRLYLEPEHGTGEKPIYLGVIRSTQTTVLVDLDPQG
ncbi:hypothetical protein [Pelagicoccus albus]|uniref:Uncharacterized protein n=1 Tax=Pelagicoccus albus TaxID=415222 RepID=A0A7X1BAQ7_9BACT|nr:hypothetical protein [Pelagicoccus albus]MBC2607500.1 hypothetical protein [Pelagicoccus albus]